MRKAIFVVSEDWYFCSHRLNIARALRENGFDIIIVTEVNEHRAAIENEQFGLVHLPLKRASFSPLKDLLYCRSLLRTYSQEKPDIVHHVGMKPVLFGGIVAQICRVRCVVNAIGGTGTVFSGRGAFVRLSRAIVKAVFRRLLRRPQQVMIVQNAEDRQLWLDALGIGDDKVFLIRGAGVDITRFSPAPLQPSEFPIVAMVSRLLWTKGVGEFVEAARLVNDKERKARFILVGKPDEANSGAVPRETLQAWHDEEVIEWWGHRDDIPEIWRQSSLAVLPSSYGEGVPKALIEAAACGRAIVTTDTPGCRDIVVHEHNGLLIPERNGRALADAVEALLADGATRDEMGRCGRRRAEREFSDAKVVTETLDVYRRLLGSLWPGKN